MQAGLLNTYQKPWQKAQSFAWVISIFLFIFYFLLYLPDYGYFPDYLTMGLQKIGFQHFSKWNLYGLLYSLGMVVGGYWMLKKHGNSRYHRWRTLSLISVQILLAFALPLILKFLGQPELYLSYLWPLSYDKLFPDTLASLPSYIAIYFVVMSLVVFPVLAFYKGKRFYCSWICGCGGLAETFGDPWRHLSNKSAKAWRFEQVSIYSVLALVLLCTGLMVADAASTAHLIQTAGGQEGQAVRLGLYLASESAVLKETPPEKLEARYQHTLQGMAAYEPSPTLLAKLPPTAEKSPAELAYTVEQGAYAAMPYRPISGIAYKVKSFYAFFIGTLFSGAAGVGLYPLMGTRVWCRFGCPMAAILGLIQKFGHFRITTKKDMCISCGNCSTYCEMGIDVRLYAMANQDIKRASCVGCGMCAHVCPRGVLKLETRRDAGPGEAVEEWVLDL